MAVDTHAHIIVHEILREAAPTEEWRPRVSWENEKQFIEYNGKHIGSATREFVNVERILDEMDKSHVDAVLLCPWVSLVRHEAKPEESLAACQVQNDALAQLAKTYPKKIAALGMIPLQDSTLAVKELARLKILLAHGGGALPALRGRLDRGFKQRPEINKAISRPPTEYLRQFYFDSITHDPAVLRSLVEFVGADHVR